MNLWMVQLSKELAQGILSADNPFFIEKCFKKPFIDLEFADDYM